MDDRRHHDDDRDLERLLRAAGPRPEIPQDDLDAIVAAGREVWREAAAREVERRRRWHGRAAGWAAGVAAALAVALGVGWWWSTGGRGGSTGPAGGAGEPVARVIAAWDAPADPPAGPEGREVTAGEEVETASDGAALPRRLALRLTTGAELRLDESTRIRLVSASEVELLAGAVYADTGSDAGGERRLAVRTALGTARDVGTRFLVALDRPAPGASPAGSLTVRVREGRVELARRGEVHRAAGGEEMVVRSDGTVERRAVPVHGAAWDWVVAAAPAFELEGSTLDELLAWVSRETGWRVRFDDPELEASAEDVVLHGTLGGLRPDQAPFAVLPGAGLEGELEGGVLVIRRGAGR